MAEYKNYKALLVKNRTSDVVDTNDRWDILVKSCPFQIIPETKELAVNDWGDEDGEDVFFPERMVYKAYDLQVTFLCVTPHGQANSKIREFWEFLQQPPLQLHDLYTNNGRQNVYYKSYSPKTFYRRDNINDIVEFSLTFRVCDPATNISLK